MDDVLRATVLDREKGYVHWRLQYGTFVSQRYGFLYMETPKNACTTTKRLLWELSGLPGAPGEERFHERRQFEGRPSIMDLEPAVAAELLTGPDTFRFCFFRDPVTRLKSAFKNKIDVPSQGSEDRFDDHRNAIRDRHHLSDDQAITFPMFAEYAALQADKDRNPHWQLQTRLNLTSHIDYTFIGRVETYEHDIMYVLDTVGVPTGARDAARQVHNRSDDRSLDLPTGVRRSVEDAYTEDYDVIEAL